MSTIERNDQRTRRVIMACELYCCLLPQCEALRICRSGFPIATVHDVKSEISLDTGTGEIPAT